MGNIHQVEDLSLRRSPIPNARHLAMGIGNVGEPLAPERRRWQLRMLHRQRRRVSSRLPTYIFKFIQVDGGCVQDHMGSQGCCGEVSLRFRGKNRGPEMLARDAGLDEIRTVTPSA